MISFYKNCIWSGRLALAFLFLTVFFGACGSDDPVAPTPATNHAPASPVIDIISGAPANEAMGVALAAQLYWTCSDPDDDPLTYTLLFGTASNTAIVAQGLGASYMPTGLEYFTTYYWQVSASDEGGLTANSPTWSFTTLAEDVGTISTPATPTGPAIGEVGVNTSFSASGAVSSVGHVIQYQFDWGDGSVSYWSNGTDISHSFSTTGTYDVMAKARCIDHPAVESAWSASTAVVISPPMEQINVPSLAYSTMIGAVGVELEFYLYGGSSSLGHPIEFQFDWADGTYSDWGPIDGTHYIRSHAWAAGGTYEITARARCIEHPEYVSDWMPGRSVEISEFEFVSAPSLSHNGELTYNIGHPVNIFAYASQSNMGHEVEYQFDVNGTLTEWGNSHLYTLPTDVPIDYYIKAHARCVEHTDVVSNWSVTTIVHIVAE